MKLDLIGGLNHPYLLISEPDHTNDCLEYFADFSGFEAKVLASIDIDAEQLVLFQDILELNYGTVEGATRLMNHGSLWDLFRADLSTSERAYLHIRQIRYEEAYGKEISPYDHSGFPQCPVPYWVGEVLMPIFFGFPKTEESLDAVILDNADTDNQETA